MAVDNGRATTRSTGVESGQKDGPESAQTDPGPRNHYQLRTSDRVSAIVTPPPDDGNPGLLLSRMSRADGCPQECGNVETPYRIEVEHYGFVGYYWCGTCRTLWTTVWRDA